MLGAILFYCCGAAFMGESAEQRGQNGKERITPNSGGEGGIRTHDTLARIPVFETGTFNRSVTSPVGRILPAPAISAAVPKF